VKTIDIKEKIEKVAKELKIDIKKYELYTTSKSPDYAWMSFTFEIKTK